MSVGFFCIAMTSPFAQLAQQNMQAHAQQFGSVVATVTYQAPKSDKEFGLRFPVVGGERTQRRHVGNELGGGFELFVTREVAVIVDNQSPKFCGVENPLSKGKLTIDGLEYRIEAVVMTGPNGSVALQCLRNATQEKTRAGLRRPSGGN